LPTWSDETLEAALMTLKHYYVPALIGRDATDIAGAHQALDGAVAAGCAQGSTSPCTISRDAPRARRCMSFGGGRGAGR
jgi:hypothetical protein